MLKFSVALVGYTDPESRNSERKPEDNPPRKAVVNPSSQGEGLEHEVTTIDTINGEPKTFDNVFPLRDKSLLLATYARGGLILSGAQRGAPVTSIPPHQNLNTP